MTTSGWYFESCKRIEVIELVVLEGEGVGGSPARMVRYYLDLDGKVLAVRDICQKPRDDLGHGHGLIERAREDR